MEEDAYITGHWLTLIIGKIVEQEGYNQVGVSENLGLEEFSDRQ